ncbi:MULTISPECIES: molybdenum cofactor guanylyltransferase [Lactobacillus]|uniref:Molybdenum cofactor guanylyltransferase n=1 Tax=Lactobacillus xujianguonis TaxID=2495899 RepID=A0A437SVM0_9LACO|nr:MULTISPECIES: molybdenum cofactor guanylyltransferase [Lactobacillus]RVU70971.1 molybdenum cofactor guanylyltransferase [Lactobacillus xujianguonis]RVU73410.1 molybdenum cofactor guanylyltransferase [Lactobacillus xujianguonis]
MLTGLVLAGGQSRRFGTDKALFTMPGQKLTNVELTVNRLQLVCDQVLVVTNPYNQISIQELVANEKVLVTADLIPYQGQGPLAGLMTAQEYGVKDLIINACDYPFLKVDAIKFLKNHPNSYLTTATAAHYTLCHLTLRNNRLENYFSAGNRALGPFLQDVCHCQPLNYQGTERELKNCNYQE